MAWADEWAINELIPSLPRPLHEYTSMTPIVVALLRRNVECYRVVGRYGPAPEDTDSIVRNVKRDCLDALIAHWQAQRKLCGYS